MIERESLIISKLILGLSPARLLLFVPGKRWTAEKMLIGSIFIDSNWASNKSLSHSFHWKPNNLNLQRQRCDINVKLSISTHLSTIDSNIYLHEIFSKNVFLFDTTASCCWIVANFWQWQLTTMVCIYMSFDSMTLLVFSCLYPSVFLLDGRTRSEITQTKAYKMHPTTPVRDNINAGD